MVQIIGINNNEFKQFQDSFSRKGYNPLIHIQWYKCVKMFKNFFSEAMM